MPFCHVVGDVMVRRETGLTRALGTSMVPGSLTLCTGRLFGLYMRVCCVALPFGMEATTSQRCLNPQAQKNATCVAHNGQTSPTSALNPHPTLCSFRRTPPKFGRRKAIRFTRHGPDAVPSLFPSQRSNPSRRPRFFAPLPLQVYFSSDHSECAGAISATRGDPTLRS